MIAIRSRAALITAVVLTCIFLVGTTAAAQPVTSTGQEAVTASGAGPTAADAPASPPAETAAGPFTIALDMPGSPALWGDVLRVTGSGAGGSTVRILVDGVEAGICAPDGEGAYRFDYAIDRIPAGTHAISADAGPGAAAGTSFEVASTAPVVLLDVAPTVWQNESALRCTGNVTVSGKGVPAAAVHLVFDNYGWADSTTGSTGEFEVVAGIPGGKHTVEANVSFDDGRPLDPAASGLVTAAVPGGPALPAWALPGLALLAALFLAGGIVAVRRRSKRRARSVPAGGDLTALFTPEPLKNPTAPIAKTDAAPPAAEAAPEPAPATPAAPLVTACPPTDTRAAADAVANGDLRAAAWALAGNGMRCGIGAVYGDLVAKLAAREPDAHLEGMTPRQLAAHFAGTPTGVAVARITACYEAVTSTWRPPTTADLDVMVEGYIAALAETVPSRP